MRYRCESCGKIYTEKEREDCIEIDRLIERVAPGEPMPAGQCSKPDCGALLHKLPWVVVEIFNLAMIFDSYSENSKQLLEPETSKAFQKAARMAEALAARMADSETGSEDES